MFKSEGATTQKSVFEAVVAFVAHVTTGQLDGRETDRNFGQSWKQQQQQQQQQQQKCSRPKMMDCERKNFLSQR